MIRAAHLIKEQGTVNKIAAFTSDFDNRKLFHTARSAREAEFDRRIAGWFGGGAGCPGA